MNEYQKRLFNAPSINGICCPICGRVATNRHHIVPRSQGGTKGATVNVCGMGNTSGCHGLLHAHKLHLRYVDDRWEYLKTSEPTKYEKALDMPGWRKLNV